jgi:hypothetical protein
VKGEDGGRGAVGGKGEVGRGDGNGGDEEVSELVG